MKDGTTAASKLISLAVARLAHASCFPPLDFLRVLVWPQPSECATFMELQFEERLKTHLTDTWMSSTLELKTEELQKTSTLKSKFLLSESR